MLLKVIAATVAAVVVARNSPTVYTLRKTDSKKRDGCTGRLDTSRDTEERFNWSISV